MVASPLLAKKCAVKGAGLQRVQPPPGNWFAGTPNGRCFPSGLGMYTRRTGSG